MQISQAISSAEIGKRGLARRHLEDFIRYVDPRFTPMPPHVPLICKELEHVVKYIETGEGTQILILETPPRHLKTTVVADHLPAWFLGRNPDKKVIDTTYSEGLAYDSSKRVRLMIETSAEYKNLFGANATSLIDDKGQPMQPVDIRRDDRAMQRWQINGHGGTFQAVGFGGTVTGRGGHLIIVDDPHASRKEAESQLERNNVWTYFSSTLYTRLEKNGAIVIIMQRWHEDDLVGRIKRLTDPDHEDYDPNFPAVRIVTLPALAERDDPLGRREGEALWPDMYPVKTIESRRTVMGPYFFSSQYQQRPTQPEGTIFKRGWFARMPKLKCTYKIQFWDTAEDDGDDNAYWACATLGVTVHGIQLIDMFREKLSVNQGVEKIIERYHMFSSEDEPIAVSWVEAKSSGKSCVSIIQAGDSMVPVDEAKVSDGDKILRAKLASPICAARRVSFLQHAPWIGPLLDELCAFPNSTYKDQTDAFVGGVLKLVHGGYVNMGAALKNQRKEEMLKKGGPMTGEMKRAKLFGVDGKGIKRRGNSMRQAPSPPPIRI